MKKALLFVCVCLFVMTLVGTSFAGPTSNEFTTVTETACNRPQAFLVTTGQNVCFTAQATLHEFIGYYQITFHPDDGVICFFDTISGSFISCDYVNYYGRAQNCIQATAPAYDVVAVFFEPAEEQWGYPTGFSEGFHLYTTSQLGHYGCDPSEHDSLYTGSLPPKPGS